VLTDYNHKARLFTDEEDIKIINLKYINGKKPKEIAKLMNRDEAQVSNRIDSLVSTNEWAKSLHIMNLETKVRAKELRDKKIISMHRRGISRKNIASQLGVARQTVTNVVTRWNFENSLSER
jgi:transposase